MSLASAVHYSRRIRCAVDVIGISHFGTFLKNTESYRRDLRRAEYGDERDPKMAEFFEKVSPLNNVDKITAPLFIIQGGNDPRVPRTEAVQMAEKIKKKLAQRQHWLKACIEEQKTLTPENYAKLPQREKNLHTKAFTTNINAPYHGAPG